MIVKNVIFDLDDTLYEHKLLRLLTQKKINDVLESYNIDKRKFWEFYSEYERLYFRKFLYREISGIEYMLNRYRTPLSCLHIENCGEISKKFYQIYLESIDAIELFPETRNTLKMLNNKGIKCFILTNGPVCSQERKICKLNIQRYIEAAYISELIGYAKPYIGAFNYVIQNHSINKAETLVVGDSLKYDIAGAANAGLSSILIDKKDKCKDYDGIKIYNLMDIKNYI